MYSSMQYESQSVWDSKRVSQDTRVCLHQDHLITRELYAGCIPSKISLIYNCVIGSIFITCYEIARDGYICKKNILLQFSNPIHNQRNFNQNKIYQLACAASLFRIAYSILMYKPSAYKKRHSRAESEIARWLNLQYQKHYDSIDI